ncbi:MAG TPA: bi-domain-containing oxidoreductase [Anaerolineales bacterium]|nr:bi-domain-containing oxidoreductase [Anaerolineales bacterium]
MKQVIQDLRGGETSVLEVPTPKPGTMMALVRTAASLVSAGTERALVEFAEKSLIGKARSRPELVRQTLDKARREGLLNTLDAVRNRLDQPMPLGYSSAGTIVELGEGLTGFRVGDRVACAGGGHAVHAEYAVVPKNLMALLPASVDFESGAFATLGAIALHAFRLGDAQPGERVAVIGLGLLGLLAGQIALSSGCRVFGVDLDPGRVDLARSFGIAAALREEAEGAAAAASAGEGYDVVLVCADTASDDPVELAGALARDRGRVVAVGAVGLRLPRRIYYEKELHFVVSRSYGPGRYDPSYEQAGHDYPPGYVRWTEGRNLGAFVEMLGRGSVDVRPLVSHRFSVERAADAYALLKDHRRPSLGVLLTYPSAAREIPAQKTHISQKPSGPTMPVRLGVLGAGNFATAVLFPTLPKVRGVERLGIAAPSGLRAATAARRFGFRYSVSDEEELLKDPEINTIAVLTRHHLHARQSSAALRAGKHVFCEKPLALQREELMEVAQALQGSDRLLCVGYNRRFARLAVRLKSFFATRQEPLFVQYRINAGLLPLDHWLQDAEQGGGRILGEVCHFVDFLTFLVGALPAKLQASALPDGARYKQDNVILQLEFPDGSLGTIAYLANGDRALPKERVEAFGEGKSAVLDDFRRLELFGGDASWQHTPNAVSGEKRLGGGRRQTWRSLLRQDKGHRAIWQAFAASVVAGGPPPIPHDELFGVTLATFAALDALRTGGTVSVGSLADGE